jgi:hypothetical protein
VKNTLKLVIPLVLGLLAGVFNFMALKSSVKEIQFIKATQDIPIGASFGAGSVDKLTILSQHAEDLKEAAVLYKDIGLLSGQTATRTIRAGDIIFYRDTEGLPGEIYDFRKGDEAALPVRLDGVTAPPKMRVGDYVELKIPGDSDDPESVPKWIGPFRLVSVGATISTLSKSKDSKRISVACDVKNKEMLDELERFIDRSRSREGAKLINIKLNR